MLALPLPHGHPDSIPGTTREALCVAEGVLGLRILPLCLPLSLPGERAAQSSNVGHVDSPSPQEREVPASTLVCVKHRFPEGKGAGVTSTEAGRDCRRHWAAHTGLTPVSFPVTAQSACHLSQICAKWLSGCGGALGDSSGVNTTCTPHLAGASPTLGLCKAVSLRTEGQISSRPKPQSFCGAF